MRTSELANNTTMKQNKSKNSILLPFSMFISSSIPWVIITMLLCLLSASKPRGNKPNISTYPVSSVMYSKYGRFNYYCCISIGIPSVILLLISMIYRNYQLKNIFKHRFNAFNSKRMMMMINVADICAFIGASCFVITTVWDIRRYKLIHIVSAAGMFIFVLVVQFIQAALTYTLRNVEWNGNDNGSKHLKKIKHYYDVIYYYIMALSTLISSITYCILSTIATSKHPNLDHDALQMQLDNTTEWISMITLLLYFCMYCVSLHRDSRIDTTTIVTPLTDVM
eukprot:128494_1